MKKVLPHIAFMLALGLPVLNEWLFIPALLVIFFLYKNNYFGKNKS